MHYKRIISIYNSEKEEVFDICDVRLSNNFVADSTVLHNCLVLDEEPRYFGMGSVSLDQAIDNLEATLRFEDINFFFVYVSQRSHKIHSLFYTRTEHFTTPPICDYFVLGVLQPVSESTTYELLGLMPVMVPDQKIIAAYEVKKKEFTQGMMKSGGFGAKRDIIDEYKWLIVLLESDTRYQSLAESYRADYIHFNYRQPKNICTLLVKLMSMPSQ